MQAFNFKPALSKSALAATALLLFGGGAAFGQQQVNLTAGASNVTLADGSSVPMWGYSCGTPVGGSLATCAKLNPAAAGWSPVVIRIPTGQDLQINLTNSLPTPPSAASGIPTSMVIVGQLGGGLGNVLQRTTTPSPDHSAAQQLTWPIADPGTTGTPPAQMPRVQSFSTEVATGATTSLTWTAPRPGTYLIESGTHPSIQGPMGLYGMLIVTCAPGDTSSGCSAATTTAGSAYPGVPYGADVPLLFSEIDPVQNSAVDAAVNTSGFSETMVWSGQPGQCGDPGSATYHQCYPPAVNYTPLYYLINGIAFDKTNSTASVFATTPATSVTGNVLVRLVNAGLRMHVPAIVGSLTGTSPVAGFSLVAEDGNVLPGVPRVQSELFMAAGKTSDIMINTPAACTGTTCPALPVFDRELSLSANSIGRDGGMLAYIGVNSATASPASVTATANADTYAGVITGQTLVVSDPAKGVIANDVGIYSVKVSGTAPAGLVLNPNGTFTYTGPATTFTYCGNGQTSGAACNTVTLSAAPIEAAALITCSVSSFTAKSSTYLAVKTPGVLASCKDAAGYLLTVDPTSIVATNVTVNADVNGGFTATSPTTPNPTFTFRAKNSQGTLATAATVNLSFPAPSGLNVHVVDGQDKTTPITDYRWIIEEDRSFYIDPTNTTNTGSSIVPTFGTNFHTSYMPVVAQGCVVGGAAASCEQGQTVLGQPAVCDVGNGVCRAGSNKTPLAPSQVALDPTKRYYISVLPGDAAIPFETGNASPGHGMGGAPISGAQISNPSANQVTVLVQPTPFPTAKLSVFVFEDDFPLNGEHDAGGGVDVISPNEGGLGGFNVILFDDAGGTGDATGQVTYDMFNQPLVNALAGQIDPATGLDACPVSKGSRKTTNPDGTTNVAATGITGTIVTCPKYEATPGTGEPKNVLSPLAGQAVVANLFPGRYGIVATPGADRIARGEEWLQTNTLDGQKAHDSFLRIGEPSFFQEYGPAGYHVSIGFANPTIINDRKEGVCGGRDPNITGSNCSNTVTGLVSTMRLSRTPDERLYGSGSNDSFAFTQCYASLGDPDGEDFAFAKCDDTGRFTLTGIPDGDWRVTVFDQWNDMLVDGLSTPVRLSAANDSKCPGHTGTTPAGTCDMGEIATNQWQANIITNTFFDQNGDGLRQANEPGLSLVATNIRFRDGSFSNFNNTDLAGNAGFNEVFPLFSWYVIETDSTRYKNTGTHVVYDAGGPADGTPCGTATTPPRAPCGSSTIAANLANTAEQVSVPTTLRVPGAVYCANADCTTTTGYKSIQNGPGSSDPPSVCTTSPTTGQTTCTTSLSTGRIDPPWVVSEGWQGFSGQNSFLEFGKKPFVPGENGGIHGHVVYASTRPFDDPQLLLQLSWEPLVPNVTVNLYQVGTAPDGSQSLKLVDTTQTSSWDNWAQGFRSDGQPNMNCPGQFPAPTSTAAGDLFFFSLYNQPNYLNVYNGTPTPLPNNSQFKCYDGMHNWNQLQPAPYDGMYKFPSVIARNPTSGAEMGTACTICLRNPDDGTQMLPAGKYVVEVVVPPGYELVKEEDKNILIGDNYIAPATVQFPGLGGAIYIVPDQAAVGASYNRNNPQNSTTDLGVVPRHEGDTGSVEAFWPCVGEQRVVPDYISLFPQSGEVAPFAGATRPLCDRKLVTLEDQSSVLAKFYIFTSTHVAAHFTGIITDDFTSEFDPFSPQFGEKFSPPDLPVSIKDWSGTEISRVYADHWGAYNGLTYSTWEVNPPNPTGYAPTMMVTCMNDPGTGTTPDPLFNPAYSQFCYEIPFMPGQTQYMDTPVTPTSAFAGAGYNNPDCSYPDATPAIASVVNTSAESNSSGSLAMLSGPWVSAAGTGHQIKITSLGDLLVNNNAYSGPSATTPPYNQKTITRHYGFGPAPTSNCGTGQPCVKLVGSDGLPHPLTSVSWSDSTITGTVPSGVPNCPVQQQHRYYSGTPTLTAQCGELVITAANGKQSIDTVTVTIGGKVPTVKQSSQTIQSLLDRAAPGDMIILPPGVYNEILLMWKPVRLQGVGAASSVLNANTHPAGKLDPWRRQVNCLFGLALDGVPITGSHPYDPTNAYVCPVNAANSGTGAAARFSDSGTTTLTYWSRTVNNPQIDRLPLEATVGWDATLNGNIAELLQEPTLMGALEGAGITVLSKGVNFPSNPFAADTFPAGTSLLTNSTCGSSSSTTGTTPFPSSFSCNPSSIDGLSITNSSQGGGGIFVHAWGHNIQIANDRIKNNAGTLSGGINIGQGEFPDAYLQGAVNAAPGSCRGSIIPNTQLPYCFDLNVNVHHNSITLNSSTGDELFSATPAGAGGVSFCTGSDFYKFNYNWVCGNLSSGDGGGLAHIGFSFNADIEHNSILFNQSTNPTIPTNGGGIVVMGPPDVDPTCGATTDQDCLPAPTAIGPGNGSGPGLVINANLILGNAAESGSGGGLRLQSVNGTDVIRFPTLPIFWYDATITNNIIANNVAGWDGAGISIVDSLKANIINNTIISNDTTASSGVLFNTIGAPLASSSGPTCTANCGTTSLPQPAGVVAIQHSAVLAANMAPPITAHVVCPANHPSLTTDGLCRTVSYPVLYNNIIWQNRAFYIGVGPLGIGAVNQQNVVALYNAFTTTQAASQPSTDGTTANGNGVVVTGGTGACTSGTSYWDIGVRGDTGPSNHSSGVTLEPQYSILTSTVGYSATADHNSASNPTVLSQYCNGSRVPPEFMSLGYQVPPGITDATVPNPIFDLTPVATVDEGNNWINIQWGPLELYNTSAGTRSGTVLGNYALATGSPAINAIPFLTISAEKLLVPQLATDFFGSPRPGPTPASAADIGAVEGGR
jgi:hypothetical protein